MVEVRPRLWCPDLAVCYFEDSVKLVFFNMVEVLPRQWCPDLAVCYIGDSVRLVCMKHGRGYV